MKREACGRGCGVDPGSGERRRAEVRIGYTGQCLRTTIPATHYPEHPYSPHPPPPPYSPHPPHSNLPPLSPITHLAHSIVIIRESASTNPALFTFFMQIVG